MRLRSKGFTANSGGEFDGIGLTHAKGGGASPIVLHNDDRRKIDPNRQKRSLKAVSRIEIVRVPAWLDLPWLVHGFSTRMGGRTTAYRPTQQTGELNLGFTASDPKEIVLANRKLFVAALTQNAEAHPLVTLKQIHSSVTYVISKTDTADEAKRKGDGMMTCKADILLGIQTADCIPVLIADRKKRAVAAFHAGWRGTLKRIVENGIGRMRLEFGSRPEDLIAAIGPGIGACCYAVGEEVRMEFESQFRYAPKLFSEVYDTDPVKEKYPMLFLTARAPGHSNLGPSLHLDLVEANRRQLLDSGINAENIYVQGDCTSCRTDRYFSHRAEHRFTGRSLSVVGIRKIKKGIG